MTIPQRIVSYHVSSFGKMSQRHFVILNIFTFITVNKSQIKRNAQIGNKFQGITYIETDFICKWRFFKPRTGKVLLFIIYFKGMQHSALRQTFCQTKSGISAIRPDLQYLPRPNHLHKHHQHPPLQMPGSHTGTKQFYVRIPIQRFQIIAFGINMLQNIFVNRFSLLHTACSFYR